MATDFASFIEELREKSNIVEVARRYINIERKGNRYWACCPIHNEKTPSFVLNEDKGLYHCFGCGASGDVFTFVQEVEHCNFKDAVKLLADRAGMQMPEFGSDRSQQKRDEERRHRERLYMLMREAGLYYYNCLRSAEGKDAMEYVTERGLNSNTLKTFGIGCSLGYDGLIAHLRNRGFTDAEMLEAGVAGEKGGKLFDFEAGRLIVPIFNNANNVVAFGGRSIVPTDFMKYKNTGETTIFKKRYELFGVHTIKKAKLTERFNCIIVVEGYMDVISLYQAGVKNVCASMGTALTPEQAKQLKHYNENVYLCYDGDKAGQNATYKGIDVLRDAGLNVKVITLPDGLDPDDVIKKYGVSKFRELIEKAVSPTEYKIRSRAKAHDLTTPEGQGRFAVECIGILGELSTMVEREAYLPMISEMSRLNQESLKKQLYMQTDVVGAYKESSEIESIAPRMVTKVNTVRSKYDKAIRQILYEIYDSNALDFLSDNLSPYISNVEHRQIYDYARELTADGDRLNIGRLLELEGNAEAESIANSEFDKIPAPLRETMLEDCQRTLKQYYYEMQLDELNAELSATDNMDEQRKLLLMIQGCVTKIKELKNGGNNGK